MSTWMDSFHKFLQKFTPCFCIPQRYILGVMTSLAIVTAYTMRICLSMAITEMVEQKDEKLFDPDACPVPANQSLAAVTNKNYLYEWNEEEQSYILSAFYWGYMITHISGALLAESFGGKYVVGLGMLINVVMTLLTPALVHLTSGNWMVLVLIRVVEGLAQGPLYPCVVSMIGQWIPAREQGAVASTAFAGALLGTAFANSASGFLISKTARWDSVFYFFGVIALIWNVLWQLLCYSYPRTHPCLKQTEAEYLDKELSEHVYKSKLKTPWADILTSNKVWVLMIGQFGHNWGWFTVSVDMPKYMKAVLRFSVEDNGVWSSIPYLVMFLTTIAYGYLADWIINRKYLTLVMTRRVLSIVGQMGPAFFIMIASYVGCVRMTAVAIITIAMGLMGAFHPGIKINALDLSPNFAGTITALANGIGFLGAMASPIVVGFLTPNQTLSEWRLVFWVCFVIYAITTTIFVVGVSGEVQPWNNPKESEA